MNRKAQVTIFVYFMIGLIFFVLGMALAPALTQTSGEAQTELNCTSSSITNEEQAICYQMDVMPSLYIGVLFGLGAMVLTRMVT